VRTLTNRALLLNKGRSVEWGLSSEVVLKYRKLLHDEEAAYFAGLTKTMAERARQAPLPTAPPVTATSTPERTDNDNSPHGTSARSNQLSFGDGEVKIIKVETLNADGQPCSVFYVGEPLLIRVTSQSYRSIDKLNVAVRLRNKEGVKIYSWGTLNQDMSMSTQGNPHLFWNKSFYEGEIFSVDFTCCCILGTNLYEVQAAVSQEITPDYTNQRILHWMDEAAFFQTAVDRDKSFFGGLVNLEMKAEW
jgi:lipopolysaccharide transport system ATP-binding protein